MDANFYLVYHRLDHSTPWRLVGFDSNPGAAEEKASKTRKDRGGVTMTRRWDGFARKERIPEMLPADWHE